jgi:hypothetical protein
VSKTFYHHHHHHHHTILLKSSTKQVLVSGLGRPLPLARHSTTTSTSPKAVTPICNCVAEGDEETVIKTDPKFLAPEL